MNRYHSSVKGSREAEKTSKNDKNINKMAAYELLISNTFPSSCTIVDEIKDKYFLCYVYCLFFIIC